jgi:Fur family ferric uptake transcriptional regulator
MKKFQRMTNEREVIIDEIRRSKNHPTLDFLFERVKKQLPRIGLSTVYRNLETMSDAGIIQKIEIGGRKKRYEWNTEPHGHIICTLCQRIEDVELDQAQKQSLVSVHDRGYKIGGYRIEFFGLCPKCQKKKLK